jgi:aspartate racemase
MHYPMNETYRWNPAEGIVGVLGVAPTATADFYRRLAALTPARKDWEHVRVLIDSNPKLPSRGRHLELGETDPSPFIAAGIRELLARGATVVAVPCNTAHVLYPRYAAEFPRHSVPHMIDLAVAALEGADGAVPQRLAVLGSRHTVTHDLYGARLRPRGGGCLDMTRCQPEISALIEHVKQGRDPAEAAARLRAAMRDGERAGADAFVIACTELSALAQPGWVEARVVDSSDTLARHCLAAVRREVAAAA